MIYQYLKYDAVAVLNLVQSWSISSQRNTYNQKSFLQTDVTSYLLKKKSYINQDIGPVLKLFTSQNCFHTGACPLTWFFYRIYIKDKVWQKQFLSNAITVNKSWQNICDILKKDLELNLKGVQNIINWITLKWKILRKKNVMYVVSGIARILL